MDLNDRDATQEELDEAAQIEGSPLLQRQVEEIQLANEILAECLRVVGDGQEETRKGESREVLPQGADLETCCQWWRRTGGSHELPN